MKLSSILNKDLIFFDADLKDYKKVYELVSEKISEKYNLNKKNIYQAFMERDKLGHSLTPKGIALPHGRIDNFDDLIIAIVKTKNSISIANGKAKLFITLLTSNTGSHLYLKSLAGFAKLISKYSDECLNISSRDEFIDFINSLDIRVDEPIRIKEIMDDRKIVVRKNEKLTDVMDKMKKYDMTYLPVVDKNDHYIGKVEIVSILKIAYPNYVLMMSDLSFLENLRPFEDFANKEKELTVEDIYIKDDKKIINENGTIIGLGFLLVKNKWHHITVVNEDNEVLGVITARDMLHNIIRA
ncbi:MAG: CBS domain-containing protein [Candidatus Mcinerneyibacterium aminivorans]|jgi:PTS system nitrogen regulatory IIA component|uniref:CBS domain-containing protein n=1 Tax=Candidatus Mcinerneyibacterium aminivorans TaxID=2703815 RepID=A0A5D0MI64_9BACT|nr:MAG: CBS domain-containing protein [Candidatus Mcinerneyibacterium aminivorans]